MFSKKSVDTSEWSFVSLSPKTIFPPPVLLEIWVQILLLQPLQLLGHSPFPIQDGILALLKGPIFSFASAHNVNELHAHSMRLQQMLVAQSQTITWSR